MKTIFLLSLLLPTLQAPDRAFLKNAQQTAHWLQSCSRQTPNGKVWAADPRDSTTVSTNLYSGSSGVMLFFLEMYRTTQNKIYLNDARAGADYLLATLPDTLAQEQSGLYTGAAGIGMLLLHLDALEQGRAGGIIFPDSPF